MQILQAVRERFIRVERRGGRIRSRVTLPAVLDFPIPVLRALREVDPMLDGYILPDGRVWILQLVPNRGRIAEGRKGMIDAKELELMPERQTILMAEGFWLVAELPFHEGTSAGAAVAVAQRVLNVSDERLAQTMAERRNYADSTTQRQTMVKTLKDRIRSDSKSDWKRSFRARRTFSN